MRNYKDDIPCRTSKTEMYFELLSLPTSVNGNSVSAYHVLGGEMWGISRKIEKPFLYFYGFLTREYLSGSVRL
jgi:hypothetical protein